MNRVALKFFSPVGFALLVAAAAACSDSVAASPTGGNAVAPADVGSVGLGLQLGSTTLSAARYEIAGPDGFSRADTVDVSLSSAISVLIGDLPAGMGFQINVSAIASDGTTTCSGSALFDIQSGLTTSVSVHVVCHEAAPQTGSALVAATVNICPVIDGLSASPASIRLGGSIKLSVVAHDSDSGPAPISYTWSATGGTLNDASLATPTFVCAVLGTQTIRVTVTDGDVSPECPATAAIAVHCDSNPPDAGGVGLACDSGNCVLPGSCANAALLVSAADPHGIIAPIQIIANTCDSTGSAPVPPSSCSVGILGKPLYYLFQYGEPHNIVDYHFDLTTGFDTFFLRADCLELGYCPTPGSFDLATSDGAFTNMIVVARPDGSCGQFTLTISGHIP